MGISCQFIRQPLDRRAELPGRIGIVIPAFNEAAHLPALLERCRAIKPAIVLVVDDASTDSTPQVLATEERQRGDAPVRVLRNPRNLGKQGSTCHGLRALANADLDAVALIDGDGQHDPAQLPALAALLTRYDLIIGARSQEHMPIQRRCSNWLVNRSFHWLGGVDFVDVQSGLRIYRKPLADVLARYLPLDGGYGLEHESLAILAAWSSSHGREIEAAAALVSCAYGEARSKMRLHHIAQLASVSLHQALRVRRALAGRQPLLSSRALTVEIHDVSPATSAEVQTIAASLTAIGIERITFLVVPSYLDEDGRRWDLRDDPQLIEWLRGWEAAGAEVIQHGLTHRAPRPPPRGLANAFMHHWFSRGTAEFAHLRQKEARERLLAGRGILQECGLNPVGFIAPAWQQSAAALRVLPRLGYRFTAFLNHLLPLDGDAQPLPSPALTFAAPNATIDHGKRLVMRVVEVVSRPAPLLRVALHPEDVHQGHAFPHVLARLRRLLRHRRAVTYSEWLGERAA